MRIVVLGTGTGVGKTFFTAALARALAAADPRAEILALKPIETGIPAPAKSGAPPPGSDAFLLEKASRGGSVRPHPRYAFPDPVSPHLAARRAQKRLSTSEVSRWIHRAESRWKRDDATIHRWLIIESAGGAFSPLGARLTNVDLALKLEPAIWILVAPDALGALHDIRAAHIALVASGRAPDFLVLSTPRELDPVVGSNAGELVRVGLPRATAVLARGDRGGTSLRPLVRALLQRSFVPNDAPTFEPDTPGS